MSPTARPDDTASCGEPGCAGLKGGSPMTNTKNFTENLTASRLREAIDLGVKMAEKDALWKLTMKAREVRAAEIERRRPRLVVDNTKRPKVVAGPCSIPILNGDIARVIELASGGLC